MPSRTLFTCGSESESSGPGEISRWWGIHWLGLAGQSCGGIVEDGATLTVVKRHGDGAVAGVGHGFAERNSAAAGLGQGP